MSRTGCRSTAPVIAGRWLDGAHVYVCGDASRMARTSDPLKGIVAQHGRLSPRAPEAYVKALAAENATSATSALDRSPQLSVLGRRSGKRQPRVSRCRLP